MGPTPGLPGGPAAAGGQAGRVSPTITDNGTSWTFAYDGDARLITACAGTTCSGSGFNRVDYLYDGDGHRTQIKETTAGGVVTTTDLRYAGDSIAQESVAGTVTRTYATDDTGRIVQVCDPDCATGTNYLVTWNGHGDATGLWHQNADGTLTLANSYTYSTWGTPTTTVASGFADLHFRFLYVGASDVQWDNGFGLGLLSMHVRTYSPVLGRFLQPDPARADGSLCRYAANSPITKSDPSGRDPWWRDYHTVYRTSGFGARACDARDARCRGDATLIGDRVRRVWGATNRGVWRVVAPEHSHGRNYWSRAYRLGVWRLGPHRHGRD